MKIKTNYWIVAGLIFLLAACATPRPTAEKLAKADYGPPPSGDYKQAIKDEFLKTLFDPTSPIYTFRQPDKGWIGESPLYGTKETFGWKVCGSINAKNRFGGYTGRKPFYAMFLNNRIIFLETGSLVAKACPL